MGYSLDYEYKLRKEDFIPVVGLVKHHKRSVSEMLRNHLVGNEEYAANASMREGLLAIYNMVLVIGTFIGASIGIMKGIEAILSK